jgi:hypothetical protein
MVNGFYFCTYGEKCWRVLHENTVENMFPHLKISGKSYCYCSLEGQRIECPNGNGYAPMWKVLERKYRIRLRENVFLKSIFRESGMSLNPAAAERRRAQRIHVQIPVFVRGVDAAGAEFLDLTKTLDISATGAFLASSRLLRAGQLLNLTIPAPPSPSTALPAETPPIQARVRRHRGDGSVHLLGVEFLKVLD